MLEGDDSVFLGQPLNSLKNNNIENNSLLFNNITMNPTTVAVPAQVNFLSKYRQVMPDNLRSFACMNSRPMFITLKTDYFHLWF